MNSNSFFAAVLALLLIQFAPPVAGQGICTSPNQFDLNGVSSKPTLAIGLFGVKFRPDFPPRHLESLRIHFAHELQRKLSKSGFFGTIHIMAEDEQPQTDLILRGDFKEVSLGTSSFDWHNILLGGGYDVASLVGVEGKLFFPGSDEPATTFGCVLGNTRGTAVGKARKSLSSIAKDLRKVFAAKTVRPN